MSLFKNKLQFKGEWYTYQERSLVNSYKYLEVKELCVVAVPGLVKEL